MNFRFCASTRENEHSFIPVHSLRRKASVSRNFPRASHFSASWSFNKAREHWTCRRGSINLLVLIHNARKVFALFLRLITIFHNLIYSLRTWFRFILKPTQQTLLAPFLLCWRKVSQNRIYYFHFWLLLTFTHFFYVPDSSRQWLIGGREWTDDEGWIVPCQHTFMKRKSQDISCAA